MCGWSFLYAFVPIFIGICVIDYKQEILTLLRFHLKETENEKFDLLIYIPSAIDNYKKRKAIRNTWWQKDLVNSSSNRTILKFVIGNVGCEVPVEYRENQYSCEPWLLQNASLYGEIEAVREIRLSNINEFKRHVYAIQKFHFVVHHSIIINKLGLHSKCRSGRVVVKLLESNSRKIIVSKEFEKLSLNDVKENFTYKSIESFILPKGFQGTLIGENIESGNSEILLIDWNIEFSTLALSDSNAIQFLDNVDPLPMGHYEDEMRHLSHPVHALSFMYTIHDIDLLTNSITKRDRIFSEYKDNLKSKQQKLAREISKYDDIFLVNVIDVYRNIPNKFLEFTKNFIPKIGFKYLLKVDDDCYVDLQNIFKTLQNISKSQKYTWIGRFRNNWLVERFGKWAEHDYVAAVYPKFACGSGYILTNDILQWIKLNTQYLKSYQGEDVSLGIWLSALPVQYMDDPYWRCTKDCLSDMYVMPELNYEEQKIYWNNKVLCNDACGC